MAEFEALRSGKKYAFQVRFPGAVPPREDLAEQVADWIATSRTGLFAWVTENSTLYGWKSTEFGTAVSLEEELDRIERMAGFVGPRLGCRCPEVTFGPSRLLLGGTRLSFGLRTGVGEPSLATYSKDSISIWLRQLADQFQFSFRDEEIIMVSGGWVLKPESPDQEHKQRMGAGYKPGIAVHFNNLDAASIKKVADTICGELGICRYYLEERDQIMPFIESGLGRFNLERSYY